MSDMYFKSLPDKSTPLIPSNLDKLNDIKVSPTEPTTNEKVWIQYSSNLFNKNNYNLFKGYIDDSTLQWVQHDSGNFIYLKVKPNTTYTISRNIVASQFAVATGVNVPVAGQTVSTFVNCEGQSSVTITTGANDNYLYIYVLWSDGAIDEVLESLQVEHGSTVTEYEPYVEKAIYVKNDNGVYEEFYKKPNEVMISGILPSTVGTDTEISFPDGFTIDNSFILTWKVIYNNSNHQPNPNWVNPFFYMDKVKVTLLNEDASGKEIRIVLKKY